MQIPYKGWLLDVANVKNRVNNFLDHSNLGESNMYFPIAVDGALVRGWEMTLALPASLAHTAGSTSLIPIRSRSSAATSSADSPAAFPRIRPAISVPITRPLDHDQRKTLNTGFTAKLPVQSWFSTNMYYGSGFSNGSAGATDANGNLLSPYQGNYLPVHTTFDISGGHKMARTGGLPPASST